MFGWIVECRNGLLSLGFRVVECRNGLLSANSLLLSLGFRVALSQKQLCSAWGCCPYIHKIDEKGKFAVGIEVKSETERKTRSLAHLSPLSPTQLQ